MAIPTVTEAETTITITAIFQLCVANHRMALFPLNKTHVGSQTVKFQYGYPGCGTLMGIVQQPVHQSDAVGHPNKDSVAGTFPSVGKRDTPIAWSITRKR